MRKYFLSVSLILFVLSLFCCPAGFTQTTYNNRGFSAIETSTIKAAYSGSTVIEGPAYLSETLSAEYAPGLTEGAGGWTINNGVFVFADNKITVAGGCETCYISPTTPITFAENEIWKLVITTGTVTTPGIYYTNTGGVYTPYGTLQSSSTTYTHYITAAGNVNLQIWVTTETPSLEITSISLKKVLNTSATATYGVSSSIGRLKFPAGTIGKPGLGLSESDNLGFFAINTSDAQSTYTLNAPVGVMGWDGSGTRVNEAMRWASSYIGTPDTYLRRDAAYHLGLGNSTNPHTFQVYNTRDADGSLNNYERVAISGTTGSNFEIKAETAGTGADNLDILLTPAGTGVMKTNYLSINSPTGSGFPLGIGTTSGSNMLLTGRNNSGIDEASIEFRKYDGSTYNGYIQGTNGTLQFAGGSTMALVLSGVGNIGIGTATFGTSAAKVIGQVSGTAPTTSPADAAQMWVEDITGSAGRAGFHIRTEEADSATASENKQIVASVVVKETTGDLGYYHPGLICINTYDNTIKMFADGAWRQLASW